MTPYEGFAIFIAFVGIVGLFLSLELKE